MRLNARILKNVANINQWEYSSDAYVQEGQVNEIYFQIIDLDKKIDSNCYMRYLSTAASIGVEVTFPSLDDAQVITATATQPFADDKSIWKVSLSSTQLPNSGSIKIKLTEDGSDKYFTVKAAIQVQLLNSGGC